jgi:hypothetical protein
MQRNGKNLSLICLIIFFYNSCLAQLQNDPTGARAVSMANASVTLRDHWVVFNNIGGLGFVENMYAFMSYENRFGIQSLQTFNAGFVSPLAHGVGGLTLSRFGDELYSEQKIGVGYSHKLGMISLGIKVNYIQIAIKDNGSKGNFTFEFGGVAKLTPQLFFGAHIYNFSVADLKGEYQKERIPVVVKAGLSYIPIEKLTLNIETEKDVDYNPTYKGGVEYEIVKNLKLRTGIQTQPNKTFFGIGFSPKNFMFDYALGSSTRLGFSHFISFSYKIK